MDLKAGPVVLVLQVVKNLECKVVIGSRMGKGGREALRLKDCRKGRGGRRALVGAGH